METKCEQLVDSEVLSSGSKEVEENDECDDGNDDGNEGCKESEQSTKYAKESVNEGNLDSCEQEEFDTVKTDLNIKHFEKSDKNESGSSPELNDKPPPLDAVNMEKSSKSIRTSQEEGSLENGKRKIKEEKTPTKVVVRRLPPSMTKEMFLDQVSPLPPVDYVYFLSANLSMGIHAFARAYLNFINQEDLFAFTRTFDNYVFLDAKGQEYPAVVEFAPFQRVPKHRITGKKKDPLCGTVECDPNYKAFKDTFLAEENEASKPNIVKQHYFETENQNMASNEEVETTPLLEFLKARRAEKARIKEEKREEKRRRDAERKLKQQQQQQQQKKKADESPQDLKSQSQSMKPLLKEDVSTASETRQEKKATADVPKKVTVVVETGKNKEEEEEEEEEAERVARNQSNYLRRMFGLPIKEEESDKKVSSGGPITLLKKEHLKPSPRSVSWMPSFSRRESVTLEGRSKKARKIETGKKKSEFSLSETEFPAFSESKESSPEHLHQEEGAVTYSLAVGGSGRPIGALALRPPFQNSSPSQPK